MTAQDTDSFFLGTRGGWAKHPANPLLGGEYGTCYDITLIREQGLFRMWFSWRPRASVAYTESVDGLVWAPPVSVLTRVPGSPWEGDMVDRPSVVYVDGEYQMWYCGQMSPYVDGGAAAIGMATSSDGINWVRSSADPVMTASAAWEKSSVMCPSVLWDDQEQLYKMWYSAGGHHEPDAVGYATSPDGIAWNKRGEPVFSADPRSSWESHKAAGCHVVKDGAGYLMFYIGYVNEYRGQIGIARSVNGVDNWVRHPQNPVIAPDEDSWDSSSCYKPFVLTDGDQWLLWYNGAALHGTAPTERYGAGVGRGRKPVGAEVLTDEVVEQIGLATHRGLDLGI